MRAIVLGLVIGIGAAACAAAPPPKDPGTIEPTPHAKTTCPLGMAGTTVAVADAPDGVNVSFTTKGNVTELRERVKEQAQIHGPGQHAGLGHAGVHNGAHTHGLRLSEIGSPVHADAIDIEGGGRVHVTAERAEDTAKVREEVRQRAATIVALGECPP